MIGYAVAFGFVCVGLATEFPGKSKVLATLRAWGRQGRALGALVSHGRIGRTYDESEPWWPEQNRAPDDAPNVLMVVLDDTGFGHVGCFGGLIDTPNLDRLAENDYF